MKTSSLVTLSHTLLGTDLGCGFIFTIYLYSMSFFGVTSSDLLAPISLTISRTWYLQPSDQFRYLTRTIAPNFVYLILSDRDMELSDFLVVQHVFCRSVALSELHQTRSQYLDRICTSEYKGEESRVPPFHSDFSSLSKHPLLQPFSAVLTVLSRDHSRSHSPRRCKSSRYHSRFSIYSFVESQSAIPLVVPSHTSDPTLLFAVFFGNRIPSHFQLVLECCLLSFSLQTHSTHLNGCDIGKTCDGEENGYSKENGCNYDHD